MSRDFGPQFFSWFKPQNYKLQNGKQCNRKTNSAQYALARSKFGHPRQDLLLGLPASPPPFSFLVSSTFCTSGYKVYNFKIAGTPRRLTVAVNIIMLLVHCWMRSFMCSVLCGVPLFTLNRAPKWPLKWWWQEGLASSSYPATASNTSSWLAGTPPLLFSYWLMSPSVENPVYSNLL